MTNKPTWGEEFDKEFPNTKFTMDPQYIKNFISTKLAEQRKEIIEKIEKAEMPGYQDEGAEHAHAGYVRALEDIINLINQD